jgi:hypothetical protein
MAPDDTPDNLVLVKGVERYLLREMAAWPYATIFFNMRLRLRIQDDSSLPILGGVACRFAAFLHYGKYICYQSNLPHFIDLASYSYRRKLCYSRVTRIQIGLSIYQLHEVKGKAIHRKSTPSVYTLSIKIIYSFFFLFFRRSLWSSFRATWRPLVISGIEQAT